MSDVTDIRNMFRGATSFDQDLGDWDVSSVTQASGVFDNSAMSIENLDATLSGWSDVETSAGETRQMNVEVGAAGLMYTDATAVNHLETEYGWTFTGMTLDTDTAWVGTDAGLDYTADPAAPNVIYYHGLGGDDIIRATSRNEHFYGGTGDDIYVLGGGIDTIHLRYTNEGFDRVAGFLAGQDMIDISLLLDGYVEGVSDINNYVTAVIDPDDNRDSIFHIDANGDGSGTDVSIQIAFLTFETTLVDDFVANGSFILV